MAVVGNTAQYEYSQCIPSWADDGDKETDEIEEIILRYAGNKYRKGKRRFLSGYG